MLLRLFYLVFIAFLAFFFSSSNRVEAVYDPLTKPNNFYGIHILFPSELEQASQLVNTSGGDWGYVIIPIQAGDRDIEKWQDFMDSARKHHLIPIIRLATEPFYEKTDVWRKPNEYDLVDFANFLNSLNWPTKNRYIVLFNEMNRFDEWGGEFPDPKSYSDLVTNAYDLFKARNQDFYLILGGLDNAAPSDHVKHMNSFEYLQKMYSHNPKIFEYIDGFSSHSYPNPGFSQPPNDTNRMGIATYKFEYDFINTRASSKKYAFITETGWDNRKIDENQIANYFSYTFQQVWNQDNDKIVAITPFLIRSENGSFDAFSFFKNGLPTFYHTKITRLAKIKGEPEQTKPKIIKDRKIEHILRPKIAVSQQAVLGDSEYLKSYLKVLLQFK